MRFGSLYIIPMIQRWRRTATILGHRPQNVFFWIWLPKWAKLLTKFQKAHPSGEAGHTTCISLRSIHPFLHSSPFYIQPQILCFQLAKHPWKCPFPWGASAPPFNARFPGSTRLNAPNCISISSAVSAQLTRDSSYILQWAAIFPLKVFPLHGYLDPSLAQQR